jgi:AcrR family transcriptional regulator
MSAARAGGRREAILEAALRLFAERGYEATTVADIRELAGASTGSMYHHFASKEDIAAALRVEVLAGYQAALLGELARHHDAEAGVRGLVRFHVAWAAANRERAGYLLASPPPAVRRVAEEGVGRANDGFFGALHGWYDAHRRAGVVRPLERDLLLAVWLGPSQSYLRALLGGREATPPGEAGKALAEAAWLALRSPAG